MADRAPRVTLAPDGSRAPIRRSAWFAILFTDRYPRGLFDFVEGVARWHNRVVGYAVTLITDIYPPF
jgi:hypothetical protein